MIRRALLITAALLLCQTLMAQTVDFDGVRFKAVPDINAHNFFGCVIMRVIVINNSGRQREIRFSLDVDYSRELDEVSKKFLIGAGEMREESMVIPIIDFSSPGLGIEVDGVTVPDDSLRQHFRIYRNTYIKKQLLIDSKVSKDDFNKAFDPTGSLSGRTELDMVQFDGSLSQLYRTWLGYSQFNALVYYSESIEKMPEQVKSAVFDYVRAGGALIVMGKTTLPDDFVRYHEKKDRMNFGSEYYRAGFGRVVFTGEDLFARIEAAGGKFPEIFPEPFAANGFRFDRPPKFDDSEIETVSARWLMILIYLFAFMIGPVNVFILHRMGRKIWVFFTVPAASVLCCVLIYSYYLVFESSVLKVKERCLTLLDERYNRAISLAYYGVYSSSSRPEGMKFDMDTEIFAMDQNDYHTNDSGKYISLDEMQHLASGWIKPKVPRYVHLRNIQTRRERINLVRNGSQIELINGLGAEVEDILVRDFDGTYYSARSIGSGAKASLRKEIISENSFVSPLELFNSGWFAQTGSMKYYRGKYLEPGQYLATLKKSPFFSQSIEKDAEMNSAAYILGIMKVEAEL